MSRIAYVDGRYVPHAAAAVHIEDRGYQFADGVYEVIHVYRGRLIDESPHLDRLDRSRGELHIAAPMARRPLMRVLREVVRRNHIDFGLVYIQITRGVARRDHRFPTGVAPVLVVTARAEPPASAERFENGVRVVTVDDIRWQRCDIKSVALLANVLGKQQAADAGAFEAWMVDRDGDITEGTSSNVWIVAADGTLVTRQTDAAILAGITRRALLTLAEQHGIKTAERAFTVAEARAAREAFTSYSSGWVTPVTQIDDSVIGKWPGGQYHAGAERRLYRRDGPGAAGGGRSAGANARKKRLIGQIRLVFRDIAPILSATTKNNAHFRGGTSPATEGRHDDARTTDNRGPVWLLKNHKTCRTCS